MLFWLKFVTSVDVILVKVCNICRCYYFVFLYSCYICMCYYFVYRDNKECPVTGCSCKCTSLDSVASLQGTTS